MANKYSPNRIVPFALIITIVVIILIAIVVVSRVLFFTAPSVTEQSIATSQQALLDTSVDRSVAMTVRGPIVSTEDYRSYQIKISSSNRNLTIYKGYDNQVVSSINLGNSVAAYEQFVYALNQANYMDGVELTGDANDIRGVCSTSRLYQFQILNANTPVKQLWTSSCSSSKGSFTASVDSVTKLFLTQITNNKSLINNLW